MNNGKEEGDLMPGKYKICDQTCPLQGRVILCENIKVDTLTEVQEGLHFVLIIYIYLYYIIQV